MSSFLGKALSVFSKGQQYPEQVLTPSGLVLPVSKGGIVRVSSVRDVFVLAHDGVAAVELERKLSADFYEAAQNADVALIESMRAGVKLFSRHLSGEIDQVEYAEGRRAISGLNSNPVLLQMFQDFEEFPEIVYTLRDRLAKSFDGQKQYVDFRDAEHGRIESIHFDGNALTGLFYYVGKTTEVIDGRMQPKDLSYFSNMLCPGFVTGRDVAKLKRKYGVATPQIGNGLFLKGERSLEQDVMQAGYFYDDPDAFMACVRNLPAHAAPELEPEELRFATHLT